MRNYKICFVLSAILLSSCSTYQGHKIAPDGTLPNERTGIPFQMTKPEYTLNISPSASDATVANYTLVANYVPDPDNRYTLALDPALFADSTFLMKFGKFGNLSQNTSGTTSRVVATLTAASSFAVSLIGATHDDASAYKLWTDEIASNKSESCSKNVRAVPVSLSPKGEKVQDTIQSEISELENLGSPTDQDVRRSQVLRYFHPITVDQRLCLLAVHAKFKASEEADTKKKKERYLSSVEKIASTDQGRQVIALVNKGDKVSLLAMKAKLDVAKTGEDVLFGVIQDGIAWLEEKEQIGEVVELSKRFAEMEPAVWKSRHLIYLERKLTISKTDLLMVPAARRVTDPAALVLSNEIKRFTADARALFDAAEMFERLDNLNAFLAKVRTTSADRDRPPRYNAVEYIAIRNERDLIESQIAKIRLEIIGGNEFNAPKAAPKIKERKGISIVQKEQSFVDAVNAGTSASKPPPYVLVLARRNYALDSMAGPSKEGDTPKPVAVPKGK